MSALERLERGAWPLAALVWLYLTLHYAHVLGVDFGAIYRGPHGLLHNQAFYPTGQHYTTEAGAYYVDPPSSPVVLAPLGILSKSAAGALFIVVSVTAFVIGLYRLASRTPIPALIMLGAGLSLPVRSELSLGNADLLCAGLVGLALTVRHRRRAVPLGLAIAIKPTVWPILVLFGVDALIAIALAAALVVVGLATIVDVGRFFRNVIPYLAHGQQAIATVRTSLTDAAVAAGLPRGPISAICLVALVAALAYILYRARGTDKAAWAPLVLVLALLLSTYSYVPYVVYVVLALPLLRPRDGQFWLVGLALYLVGSSDVWNTNSFPHQLNTLLGFQVLVGLLLLVPIAANPLRAPGDHLLAPDDLRKNRSRD